MAARTYQQAQHGAVDPVNLAAMIEVAVARATQQNQPAPDPMANVLKGFELANMFQTKSMEAAKSMLGVTTPAETAPTTFADVLIQLGPQILDVLKTVAPMVAGAIAANTAPAAPVNVTRLQPRQSEQRPMSREQAPQQTAVQLPTLTPQETQETAPIIAVMKPYAAMLADALTKNPPEALAQQLGGMIGPDLWESVLALDAAVQAHGLETLAHIGPHLATPAAGIVVHLLAQDIEENMQPEEPENLP
jgi:hypothetical protein